MSHSDSSVPGFPDPAYLIHSYEHRAYPLDNERTFTIGRHSTSDIVIHEVAVSRHHAEVKAEGGKYILNPVGRTPTKLNGSTIHSPHTLRPGDQFTVGSMRFQLSYEPLPVAISVAAQPFSQYTSSDQISDMRHTLTYPVQSVTQGQVQTHSVRTWTWIVVVLLAAVVVYAAFEVFGGQ